MHIDFMMTARKTDKARGQRIKFVRTQILKLRSQEALAKEISKLGEEVTRGAVGNWELGKEIGIKHLASISLLSGAKIEWLASNTGAPPTEKVLYEDSGPIWLHQLKSAVEIAQAEGASAYQIHEAFESLVRLDVKRKLRLLSDLDSEAWRSLEEVVEEDARQSGKSDDEGKEGNRG